MASVELNQVTKRYPGAGELALDALTIDIADGEFFVLLGPSGCGKSTALRMIAGLESITSGTLSIGGKVMNTVPAKDRDIAMVFQTYALYPHMTVAGNLGFGLRRRGFSRSEIERRVTEVAAMLELTEFVGRKPHALSGGQRQRVALGRAIVRDPEVFLFDEPLSNLDATLRLSTRNELVKLHRRIGTTMVYVTHDQVEAMTMGERICIMNNGRLAQIGTPLEVYRDPADMFVARFLGSPPMNLIGTVLRAEGEALFADIGPAVIPLVGLPPEMTARYGGQHVVLGIRPEDIYQTERGSDIRRLAPLAATVVTVEALGAETLLNLDAPGLDDVFRARVGREATLRAGDRIEVHLDLEALYLFDPDTSQAIAMSRAHADKGKKRRPTG